MAEVTRSITGVNGAMKVGNVLQLPMSSIGTPGVGTGAYLSWEESTSDSSVTPRITDQIFRLVFPEITGTTADTYLVAWVFIADVSINFDHVRASGEFVSPTLRINDAGLTRYEPFDIDTQSWVRIQQDADSTTVSLGPDGTTWTAKATNARASGAPLELFYVGMDYELWDEADPPDLTVGMADSWSPSLPAFGDTTYESDPGDPDPPPDFDDPFDPNATAPAKLDPECLSVIEMIREFSAQVRRAVRITGPDTITMVDPNEPPPAGYGTGDGADMYHNATQQLVAGTKVLSMLQGRLALSLTADMVTNDARLVTAGWLAPDRLPSPTTAPVPVKRVTYSFTPDAMTTSVEFHTRTAPLNLRR